MRHCAQKIVLLIVLLLHNMNVCAYSIFDYNQAMNEGQYNRAILIMTEIIKDTENKNGDLYYKRACAYEKAGNYIYAVIDCSVALEYSPNSPEYYSLRGKCKQMSNDPTYLADLKKGLVNGSHSETDATTPLANNHSLNYKSSYVDTNIPITNISNPHTFVVIICAEEYSETNISNADFANNDGEILKEYCIKTLGIPDENIHFKKNVTLSQIKTEMRWLKAISKEFGERASALVYFSGHGYPDEITHQSYILPSDGQVYDTDCGYSLATLYSELGNLNFKYSIVLLDACFSGVKRSASGGMLSSTRGIAIKPTKEALYGNIVVLSATSSENVAYPDKKNSHGLFTYHLLEKIRQTKGVVSIQELGNYVIDKVRETSTIQYTKPQIPVLEFSDDLKISLSEINL